MKTVCYSCHTSYVAADTAKRDKRCRGDSRGSAALMGAAGGPIAGQRLRPSVTAARLSHDAAAVMDEHWLR